VLFRSYWLVPRLWNTKLYSDRLANLHFWVGMIGILFYVASMWVAGIGQGLSLNQLTADGSAPANSFIETLKNILPMYYLRALGGGLYLTGYVIMIVNLAQTIRQGVATDGRAEVREPSVTTPGHTPAFATFLNAPVLYSSGIIFFSCLWILGRDAWMVAGLVGTVVTVIASIAHFEIKGYTWKRWHEDLLHNALPFSLLTVIAVAIGGALQIVPTVILYRGNSGGELLEGRAQRPYSPLERTGRNIYVREGCYNCHSQMIRPLRDEVERYGHYSLAAESMYDHPFQWGPKRTGPDIARVGGKYSDDWHQARKSLV